MSDFSYFQKSCDILCELFLLHLLCVYAFCPVFISLFLHPQIIMADGRPSLVQIKISSS